VLTRLQPSPLGHGHCIRSPGTATSGNLDQKKDAARIAYLFWSVNDPVYIVSNFALAVILTEAVATGALQFRSFLQGDLRLGANAGPTFGGSHVLAGQMTGSLPWGERAGASGVQGRVAGG
jgi:hypothetical protein